MAPVQERVDELEAAYESKQDRVNEIVNSDAVQIDGENVEVKVEAAQEVRALSAEMKDIKGLIESMTSSVSRGRPAEPENQSYALGAAQPDFDYKSIAEHFIESDEFQTFVKSGRYTMDSPYEIQAPDLAGMSRKDVYTGMVPGTTTRGFGRRQQDPMVPRTYRNYRVRDLFPVVGTSANLIDYFRVTGFTTNVLSGAAGPVRERAAADGVAAPTGNTTDVFGLKPRSQLIFTAQQAPVRTLAHYEVAHRNVLADEPQLRGVIDNELMYGLAIEEDRQILNGTGNNEDLLGILVTPNIQTYTQTSGGSPAAATELKSDALRRAATKVVLANYAPTGYVLHPNDWEDIELQKGGTAGGAGVGDGQYMLFTNISIGAGAQVWRQPVVETAAMTEGTFLTGAFGIAAQLYDRSQSNIRIAEQHADFFVRNAIVILAEQRLALACKRPEAFVRGTFFN